MVAGTRSTALVGRERHLREASLLVESACSGNGFTLVLVGEAGAGKTRLAEETAALAERTGVRVTWTTCWHNATAPLAAWTELTGQLVEHATDDASASASPDGDPDLARSVWLRRVLDELLDAVADPPTLLVVDDLQWADALSMRALAALAAKLRGRRLGLLCTVRDDPTTPADAVLDAILRAGRTVVVPPLTEAELGELVNDLTGRPLPPAALTRLHDRTAGNVLFARELLRVPAGPDRSDRATAAAGTAIFTDRLDGLSADALLVLQAASVLGRRFRLDVLAESLARPVDDVLEALGEAETMGLVRGAGVNGFEFAHPLIAEACYQSAGLPRRVRLHRDVAEALERLQGRGLRIPAVEIAHHFAHAAPAGVAEKAAHYAALAGTEDMAQLSYEDAVRDFRLALRARELCPVDERARARLLLSLGDALSAVGDRVAARDTYESAGELARGHGWTDVLADAALGIGSGPGGFEVPPFDDHQIALLSEAATVATGTVRARVLARLSVALALDPAAVGRRAELSEEAISIARSNGDQRGLGYALASWCDVFPGPDRVEDRLDASDEILRCAVAARDLRLELLGRRLRAVALLEAGRIAAFDAEVAAFAASAERVAEPGYSFYVPLWRAMRAAMEGRLDDAERLRHEAAAIGELAQSENAMILTKSQQSMIACEIRAAEEAVAFFGEVMDTFPDYGIMTRPAYAYALATAGDLAGARSQIAAIDAREYSVESLGSEFLTTLLLVTNALWLTGTAEHAAVVYDGLVPHRGRFAIDGIGGYFAGSVERNLGQLAALRGNRELARAHFDAALDHHRRLNAGLLVAATLRDAAECLDDVELAASAREAFAALGHAAASTTRPSTPTTPVLRRDGDTWLLGWDGSTTNLRHSKGMADLACLLAQPDREVHVLDLVAAGPTVESDAAGGAIDDTARRRYRARLAELDAELAEADDNGDVGRSERLQLEREALIAELTTAYGLGGRARRTGASSERARSAVTQRLRDTIARIERVHPSLGIHLRASIHTGTFCAYRPSEPVAWEVTT